MYGKSACPVLRGAGVQPGYGRDIVAPPRKQAANGEDEHRPVALGDSCLLEDRSIFRAPDDGLQLGGHDRHRVQEHHGFESGHVLQTVKPSTKEILKCAC